MSLWVVQLRAGRLRRFACPTATPIEPLKWRCPAVKTRKRTNTRSPRPQARLQLFYPRRTASRPHNSPENSAGGLERINRAYRFKKDVPDETGFTPSYIVLHAVPGGHVFSTAEPL